MAILRNEHQIDILYKLIKDTFNLGQKAWLNDTMKPEDVPGWDSLGWVTILTAIQNKFNVDITVDEAADIKTVGDIRKLINKKYSNNVLRL